MSSGSRTPSGWTVTCKTRGSLDLPVAQRHRPITCIPHYRDTRRAWHGFLQEPEALGTQLGGRITDPGEVSPWPREARDQTGSQRIAWRDKNDWDDRRRFLRSLGSWPATRQQQIDFEAHKLSGQPRQPLDLGFRPAARIGYVFTVHVAELLKRLT
jgi:hypothetical protein